MRGEIHADFLPVTADRSGFVLDRDEYRAFVKVMDGVMGEVRRAIERLSDRKDRQKTRAAAREAFRRIQNALARNPDLSPFGPVPYAAPSRGAGGAGVLSSPQTATTPLPEEGLTPGREPSPRTGPRRRHPTNRRRHRENASGGRRSGA